MRRTLVQYSPTVRRALLHLLHDFSPRHVVYMLIYRWSHATDIQQSSTEIRLLQDVQALIKGDRVRCEADNTASAFTSRAPILRVRTKESAGQGLTLQEFNEVHSTRVRLMLLLLENEVSRLNVWKNPLNEHERGGATVGAVERAVKTVRLQSNHETSKRCETSRGLYEEGALINSENGRPSSSERGASIPPSPSTWASGSRMRLCRQNSLAWCGSSRSGYCMCQKLYGT